MSKRTFVAIIGVISFFYLINPGAGVFELIPDNFPFVGNLDEATATLLLFSVLRYFGFDFINVFKKQPTTDN